MPWPNKGGTSASWKLLNSIFIKVDDLRFDGVDMPSFSCSCLEIISDPTLAISLTSKSFEIISDDSLWRNESLLTTEIEPSSSLLTNFKKSFWSFSFLFPYNYYLLDLCASFFTSKSVADDFFILSVAVFSPPSLLSI